MSIKAEKQPLLIAWRRRKKLVRCSGYSSKFLLIISSVHSKTASRILEEQREKGANLDVDVPWKYLNFFMEDDEKLAEIGEAYSSGKMLTGEIKAILIDVLADMVERHQRARALVTDEIVDAFLARRPLSL